MDRDIQMEIKTKIGFFSLIMMFLLQACSGTMPTKNEIIGKWKAEDGATFTFHEDGTFMTKDLSGGKMFKSNRYQGKKYSESGVWSIEQSQGRWVIELSFKSSASLAGGYATQLLVSGSGILENDPPWNLFVWVGEAGGERYEFEKQ